MSCNRWIAVCVDMLDHPVVGLSDPKRLAAWLWLISKAAWRTERFNHKGKPVTLQRGQILIARAYLATEWKWSEQSVRTFLALLVKEGMIEISNQSDGHYANVATICNYEKFQNAPVRDGQCNNQSPTRAQPEPNQTSTKVTKVTNKQPTSSVENHAAHERASEPPREAAPLSPAELSDKLVAACNGALANPVNAQGLLNLAVPMMWLDRGACLDRDVIPTLEAAGKKYHGKNISSWSYFSGMVAETVERRKAGLPPVQPAKPKKPRHLSRY